MGAEKWEPNLWQKNGGKNILKRETKIFFTEGKKVNAESGFWLA